MWQQALLAGGDLLGSYLGMRGQTSANRQNQQMAREQMAFQERMANTAWQRGVSDMRAAGLNPMLAYAQGGASAPSGALSTSQNAYAGAPSSFSNSARALSMEMRQLDAQIDKARSEVRLNNAATGERLALKKLAENNALLSSVSAKHALSRLPQAVNTSRIHNTWYGRHILGPIQATLSSIGGSLFGGANSAASIFSR